MEFANATYLWGLLGLLVPIAIHLWSRKKVVTIKIGSIKFLEASEPKQTSSIKLNEWWLLFLRVLSILLLVLIISEPSITRSKENIAVSYVVEPSLINDERMASLLDTLPEGSVRLLEKGFPEWEDADVKTLVKNPNYWQLAQEMKSISADSIIVFSRGLLKGIHGSRPNIHANTKWIIIESEEVIEKSISAIQKSTHIELLSVSSSGKQLAFQRDSIANDSGDLEISGSRDSIKLKTPDKSDWMTLTNQESLRVGIVSNDSLTEQYLYLRAAYRAISKYIEIPIEVEDLTDLDPLKTSAFNTIIVYENEIPKGSNGTFLIFRPDKLAKHLITEGPSPNIFYLTKFLDSENSINEQLPEKLLALLQRHKDVASSIEAIDQRILSETELQPIRSKVANEKNIASIFKITPWLWLFLVLVLLVERMLSKYRKQ